MRVHTWFDPAAPGVGVSLSLAPDAGHEEPTAVLFLATLSSGGIDVRFPIDDAMLRQLTHTFGLPSCEPSTTRPFGD